MSSDDLFKGLRKEYEQGALRESEVSDSPFVQFKEWFHVAMSREGYEPNACALATASRDGAPSVRMVLLKAFDDRGFVFFTNYESQKGMHIMANPQVALLFYWPALERQVRIEGVCEKVSDGEADSYFASRPKSARLGAVVSSQSRVASSREEIEESYEQLVRRVGDGDVQRPSHWGGYRVVPIRFEFWQGRESRLHDRLRYEQESQGWRIERLWP